MGKLFIVATPIGNLQDISRRALEILEKTEHIVAEDPGHSKGLFQFFKLGRKTWMSLPKAQEHDSGRIDAILRILESHDVALISDAGSPCIQDPGSHVIDKARSRGVTIEVIPGVSSVIAALQLSGSWKCRGFSFLGFSSDVSDDTWNYFSRLPEPWALVVFVPPHSGSRELRKLVNRFPDARVSLCFELTKMHERVIHGIAREIVTSDIVWKGECVVVIEVVPVEKIKSIEGVDLKFAEWLWGHYRSKAPRESPRQFAKSCAQFLGCTADEFYKLGYRDET